MGQPPGKRAPLDLDERAAAVSYTPIGRMRTPFPEKFGIPRQPNLAREAIGVLRLPASLRDALRGLEAFSHAWVLFAFDRGGAKSAGPLVRPPRLGGSERVGIFATRSPHRPNPIGLSAFEIQAIHGASEARGPVEIRFRGVDLLDGTPVLDLKPYLPYADAIPRARASGWAKGAPARKAAPVRFSAEAAAACRARVETHPGLRTLIRSLLALDPRPAFQARRGRAGRTEAGVYSMRLMDLDVHWQMESDGAFIVLRIERYARQA